MSHQEKIASKSSHSTVLITNTSRLTRIALLTVEHLVSVSAPFINGDAEVRTAVVEKT